MSANILNGFQDLVSKSNILTNGSFLIDQRAVFSTYAYPAYGDFISDCWIINSVPDECMVLSAPLLGYVDIKGRGQKGQVIQLRNIDVQPFGTAYTELGSDMYSLTGSVGIYNNPTGLGGVPLSAGASPSYNGSGVSELYDKRALAASGKASYAVNIQLTKLYGIDNQAGLTIRLEADGKYEVRVFGFKQLIGAYRNPPEAARVSIADDLVRCERFYQTGAVNSSMISLLVAGTQMYGYLSIPFRTTMLSAPGVTISKDGTNWDVNQLAELGTGATSEAVSNWTTTAQNITTKSFMMRHIRGSVLANRSLLYSNVSWIATV